MSGDVGYSTDPRVRRPIVYTVERTMRGLDSLVGSPFWTVCFTYTCVKGARPPARASWLLDRVYASVQGFNGNEVSINQRGSDPYYMTDGLNSNVDWRSAGAFPFGAIFLNQFAPANLVYHWPVIGRSTLDGQPIDLSNPIHIGAGERLIFAFGTAGNQQIFPTDAITIGGRVTELPEPEPSA